ncbi:MAG: hypothetical protein Tsb0020_00690 [Haliangiales bacterium]
MQRNAPKCPSFAGSSRRTLRRSAALVGALWFASSALGGSAWAQNIVITPTTVDVGAVDIGAAGVDSFTISNSDTNSLTVGAVAEDPQASDDCGPFVITPRVPLPATLPEGDSFAVEVSFTPTARASARCTVTVTSDDPGSPDTVILQGQGQAPLLEVAPGAIDFGDQRVGAGQATDTITITNNGNVAYTMVAADVTVSGDPAFVLTDWPPALLPTLAVGASVEVAVGFDPAAQGAASANVQVEASAHPVSNIESPQQVSLAGNGTAAVIAASGNNDFGALLVGTSVERTYTISNQGDAALQLETIALQSPSPAGQFAFVGAPPSGVLVAPGTSVDVTVRCTPSAIGLKTVQLSIPSDADIGQSLIVRDLSCRGQQPNISVDQAELVFAPVRVGESGGNQTVTIANAAGVNVSPLTVSSIALTAGNVADFSAAPSSAVLGAGQSVGVAVGFQPTAPGPRVATLTITSDDPDQPTITVEVRGEGREAPEIAVAPAQLSFGDQQVDSTSQPQSFSISNAAGAFRDDLNVANIQVIGANAADFAVSQSGATVPAGNSALIDVTFTPQAAGARSAQVRITSDDADEGTVTIDLSGSGVAPDIALLTPPSVDFGQVGVSQSSQAIDVIVRNDGNADLVIIGVNLSGTEAGDFSFSGPTNVTLAPGDSNTWQVSCSPTAVGGRSAAFNIPSNDADEANVAVALDCEGVVVDLVLSQALAFPDTYVGDTSAPISVDLINNGATVDITSIAASNSVFRIESAPSVPFTLAGGEQVALRVSFLPTASQSFAADLVVTSNDFDPVTFPMTGRGIIAELGVSPGNFDFAEIRVGLSSPARVFTLSNIATAPLEITSVTLDDNENFALAPLGVALPVRLDPNAGDASSITVSMTAQPQTIGAISAALTIVTDIPGAGPISVPITVTGTAPDLAISQNAVDFGGVDIQLASSGRETVTVTNTGTLDLAIGNILIEGDPDGAYGLADGQAVTTVVVPGGSFDVVVEYLPLIERADSATLVIESDALIGPRITVPLSGRGIDRHIEVSALELSFPATYRNPSAPSQIPLEISNTGDAPLVISMIMTEGPGAPAFALESAELAEVMPGASVSATVSFAPTAASGVPYTASLWIINDDDDRPMVEITMSGVGLAPNLQMAPGGGILLTTGVGVPTRIAEIPGRTYGMRLSNQDAGEFSVQAVCLAATVAEITRAGAEACGSQSGPFRVVEFSPGVAVAAGGALDFDVEFLPTQPGLYETAVAVFLAGDPEPVVFTVVRGQAVEIGLSGSGCDAGAGGAGSLSWLPALLALLALWAGGLASRRRALRAGRRTPWRRRSSLLRLLGAVGVVVVGLVVGLGVSLGVGVGPAAAQSEQNLDLALFRPVPTADSDLISVEDPRVGADGAWSIALALHHALNPLELDTARMQSAPVSSRTAAELGASYAFLGRYEAGLVLPLMQQRGDSLPAYSGLSPAEGVAVGDLTVRGKVALWGTERLRLASSLEITAPTASRGQYAGARRLGVHARGVAGYSTRRVQAALNAGVRVRGRNQLADVEQGSEVTYGAAGGYRVLDKLAVIAELYGAVGFGAGPVSPLEAALGVRYRPTRTVAIVGGVGRGIIAGIGAPEARGFLLLSFSPAAREPVPVVPPPPPKPLDDGDGDGILDADDACPDEEEDRDGFQDEDGCLDPDNDNDGRIDLTDECVSEPEDYDGFQDEDGCPDGDNDGDGVPDDVDLCPDQPEDADGFQDQDGCDDPDNDRDGIPDFIDQCVAEAETINGNEDSDGCPDEGESLIMLLEDRVELFTPLDFRGNSARLTTASETVLAQVASLLRAHPEFVKVRVGAHVSVKGERGHRISQQRADAIKEWLVGHGIEPERVEAVGYGGERPLLTGGDRAARAVNERVEFVIVETRADVSAE